MFNAYPPPAEAMWFMEYVLFGWYWHPFLFFGWLLGISIIIALFGMAIDFVLRKIFLAVVFLALFVIGAQAQSSTCLGSCWACMHGCSEAQRVEYCCPAGTPPQKYPLTHPTNDIEARIDAAEKRTCRRYETLAVRDVCFYLLGREHGRFGR